MFGGRNSFENRRVAPSKKSQKPKTEKKTSPNKRRPVAKAKTPRGYSVRGGALKAVRRVLHVAVRLAVAAVVTGGVLYLGMLAYRHATQSDYFSLVNTRIIGNKRLTHAEISEAAGLIEGKNIFKIDLAKAGIALKSHPWITEAEVSRRLPDTINVQMVEREAMAMVNLDMLYLVDDMGQVFKRWVPGDPVAAPIITGISRAHYIESPKEVENLLCDAIDLAKRYDTKGLGKIASLDEVHVESQGGFSMTVGGDPIYVKFGKGPYRTKLARLSTLLRRLNLEQKRASMIFFDNEVRPDRITVKLKKAPSPLGGSHLFNNKNNDKKIMSKI